MTETADVCPGCDSNNRSLRKNHCLNSWHNEDPNYCPWCQSGSKELRLFTQTGPYTVSDKRCDHKWHDQPAPSEGQKATMAVAGLVKAFDGIGKGRAVNRRKVTDEMVNRFLSWKIPESVCSDLCMNKQGEGRNGTSIMNAMEARTMLEHVLSDEPATQQPGGMSQHALDNVAPAEPISATPSRLRTESAGEIAHEYGRNTAVVLKDDVDALERELAEAKHRAAKLLVEFAAYRNTAESRVAELQAELIKEQELTEGLSRLSSEVCNQRNELQAKLDAETARADQAHNAAIDKCYQISIDWDQLTYDEFRDKYSPKFHRSLAILALKSDECPKTTP